MQRARKWADLSPRVRRVIVISGIAETVLKVIALADLRRRPRDQIRGPKQVWVAFVLLVNSFGLAPLAYLCLGRRRPTLTSVTPTDSEGG
jgi:hypothetical protein